MTFVRLVYMYSLYKLYMYIRSILVHVRVHAKPYHLYTSMCIIHRSNIINFIKGHALIHREFNTCLEKIDPDLTG